MTSGSNKATNAGEIDRLALALAKEPGSKAFIPLADEYGKAGMWEEAAAVLEDGLKTYPTFVTAMVALGRAYDQLNQLVKAKAILEEAVKLSPENLRAHRTLAKIYVGEGARDAALRSCNVILAVNHQDQEALSLCTMLGVPVDEVQAGPSIQIKAKQADQSSPPAGASIEGIVGSHTAVSELAAQSVQQQSTAASHSSDRDHLPITSLETAASRDHKRAAVMRLRQWLNSIQIHRKDLGHPA